jgi:hypothetical protein
MTAVNAERQPLADTGGLTGRSRWTNWLHDHACVLVALLSCSGAGLLIASEITDRLERVEGDLGPTALNLAIATPLALLVVSTAALVGDSRSPAPRDARDADREHDSLRRYSPSRAPLWG